MANTIKTGREDMIDAALGIIEESGVEGVSVRTVARRLGISTQPIYREFGDMDSVMRAVKLRGYELWWEYLKGEAQDQAARYVMFAVERSNLFRFLMTGGGEKLSSLDELKRALIPSSDIISRLREITGLDEESVYDIHLKLWLALHGLAVMAADGKISPSADEVKAFVREMTAELAAGKRSNK